MCQQQSRTFRELAKLLLHVRHGIPLGILLLRRSSTTSTRSCRELRSVRTRARRIRELARLLLLLLLSQCDLIAGITLLVFEHQLPCKLLVKLSLFGLLMRDEDMASEQAILISKGG